MDENTRFLVERMDNHFREVREELKDLKEKVGHLEGFRQRVMGGAAIVSVGVSIIAQTLIKKLGG